MTVFEFSLHINCFPIIWAKKQLKYLSGKMIDRRDAIVAWHLHENPYYRTIIGNKDITRFEDLPIITKHDLQKPLEQMLSNGYTTKNVFISSTSGSSGHPFFFAKDKRSHALTHAIILDLYANLGLTPKDKQARFYGVPLSGNGKYKEKIKDFLSNRVRFHVFDLSDEQLSKYLNKIKNIKFGYVYGYTSAIVQFAKYCNKKNIILSKVCPSLKCCIVTSEVCTEEDRNIIENAFGIDVYKEYGCSEAGLIAFEGRDKVWKMIDKENYFEVVDNDGNVLPWGQEGRILLTSLSNKAMPFIRYEIGDVGIIKKLGADFVLDKLSGRVSDYVKLPSGKVAAGLTFYYISRAVLERNSSIKEFIVRQTSLDTFVFDMVLDADLNSIDIDFLQEQLHQYLEPGLKLIVNRVDKINRPNSGKIKHFYSEL